MTNKFSHLAELFLQDSLYPLLMRRKCGNVSCMSKSLHLWGVWQTVSVLYVCARRAALYGPLRESLRSSATVRFGWRSLSSCGLKREMLFHVSALPLADQLLLFIFTQFSLLNKLPVCLRLHGHGPPKSIGRNGRTDWMVSVWMDGLLNFGEKGHFLCLPGLETGSSNLSYDGEDCYNGMCSVAECIFKL